MGGRIACQALTYFSANFEYLWHADAGNNNNSTYSERPASHVYAWAIHPYRTMGGWETEDGGDAPKKSRTAHGRVHRERQPCLHFPRRRYG